MSQQANITVFDGASTPVSHTLVGEGVEKDANGTITARWKESLPGVPDDAQVRLTMTKRKLPSGVFRVTCQTEIPVMESISGQNSSGYTAPPKVAYVDQDTTVQHSHGRSTVTSRRLARQLHVNILNGVSTSVVPVTTTALAELFDQLIVVS